MTTTQFQLSDNYPSTIKLANDQEVILRILAASDVERITTFARSLPEDDLLFLRVDITDPQVVREWIHNQATGHSLTLIAEVGGEIAGYSALVYNQTNWQRHLGEIRILAGRRYRGQRLGRALAAELFRIARALGLRKITAQMPRDQQGAKATFERLGFQPEALLQNYVIDRTGVTHDLVVMTYDFEDMGEATR